MKDREIEDALRAGPPDELAYPGGAFERGLTSRTAPGQGTISVRGEPATRWTLLLGATIAIIAAVIIVGRPLTEGPSRSISSSSRSPSPSTNNSSPFVSTRSSPDCAE